jgi:translation initiation factor 2B subunit (eIF-2B alpha/beta/delta family)
MQDPWDAVVALAGDRSLGATETSEQAARALARIPPDELPDAIETLLRGHPCMAPLWRLASVLLSNTRNPSSAAERFAADLADHGLAAALVAPLLPSVWLTISASAAVREAIRIRKPSQVHCMSSLPGGEGLQMAGNASAWTEATVIADDVALQRIPGDAVVVGADAVTPTAVVNKVKTRELVEAAQSRGISAYAIVGSAKFIPFEVPVVPPFQATPIELFRQLASPGGMLDPSDASKRAAAVQLHPALPMLAKKLAADPELASQTARQEGAGEHPA